MLAVVLQFLLSRHVLEAVGVTKPPNVHVATLLLCIGAVYSLTHGVVPLSHWLRKAPGLMLFLAGIPALMLYSVYFNGLRGWTVFIETFLSAGLLALLLEPASVRQRQLLGRILMGLVLVNCVVGLYESAIHEQLFPADYDPDATDAEREQILEEFRAQGFYEHPLSASAITSIAFFLLYSMRMRFITAALAFGLMLIGMFAFGGRTSLAVMAIVSVLAALYALIAGLVKRRLRPDLVQAVVTAAIAVPIVVVVVVTQTSTADRIVENLNLSNDTSAAVRVTQWEIFHLLDLQQWLFGISKDQLAAMKYRIGLGGNYTDIENPWILLFLDLGVVGFAVFMTVMMTFIVHLGRFTRSLNGWLIIISSLIVQSSSNSLGVSTNELMLEVAFLMALSGFRDYRPVAALSGRSRALPGLRRMAGASGGLRLAAAPMQTLRGLAIRPQSGLRP
ncbi:MAG: VpsF family polysaccharide biosynthesis protein [Rhodopila sp.]